MENTDVIYPITVGDLQDDAVRIIGRKLDEDELITAKKCVEWGLSSVVDITLKSAIEEAIDKDSKI